MWLVLPACSAAGEAAAPPDSHDVVEVAVAPPPSTAAMTAVSERVPPQVSASAEIPMAFDPLGENGRFSAGLGRVHSSSVAGGGVPSTSGSALVTLLANAGGRVDNAGAVVAGMTAGFRRCYRRGLSKAPTSAGRVQILAKLLPNGEVGSATPNAVGTLDPSVVSCLAARVSSAQFARPDRLPSTLTISVMLSPN